MAEGVYYKTEYLPVEYFVIMNVTINITELIVPPIKYSCIIDSNFLLMKYFLVIIIIVNEMWFQILTKLIIKEIYMCTFSSKSNGEEWITN